MKAIRLHARGGPESLRFEQALIRVACSDPPERACHWTLQLQAGELVALGLVGGPGGSASGGVGRRRSQRRRAVPGSGGWRPWRQRVRRPTRAACRVARGGYLVLKWRRIPLTFSRP